MDQNSWFFGLVGFTNGPRMLKNVFTPKFFLVFATCFIAGWKRGACKKQILDLSKLLLRWSELFVKLIPKCSKTLLDPHPEETP